MNLMDGLEGRDNESLRQIYGGREVQGQSCSSGR